MTEPTVSHALGSNPQEDRRPPFNPDHYLYHYTSAAGLLGIFSEQALWATDALYLNDESELAYAVPAVEQELNRRTDPILSVGMPEIETPERAVIEGATIVARITTRYFAQKKTDLGSRLHVACLCAKGDLLSQWRGYANGNGFAIALEPEALKRIVPNPGPNGHGIHSAAPTVHLEPVRYGNLLTDDRRKDLSALVDRIIPPGDVWYSSHPARPWQTEWATLEALAYIKHESFVEEDEYRLAFCFCALMQNNPEVSFRSDAHFGMVPFIRLGFPVPAEFSRGSDMPFDSLTAESQADILKQEAREKLAFAIRGVVIGPGSDRQLRTAAVQRLFDAYGLKEAEIWYSAAPFRG